MLDIARANELGLIELMAANPGIDPWLPGAGVKLLLPTMHIMPDAPRKGIVINTAELRLYYYGEPKKSVVLSARHRPRRLPDAARAPPRSFARRKNRTGT